jgi:hypothetical protein
LRAAYWATSAVRDPTISFEFIMEAFLFPSAATVKRGLGQVQLE